MKHDILNDPDRIKYAFQLQEQFNLIALHPVSKKPIEKGWNKAENIRTVRKDGDHWTQHRHTNWAGIAISPL